MSPRPASIEGGEDGGAGTPPETATGEEGGAPSNGGDERPSQHKYKHDTERTFLLRQRNYAIPLKMIGMTLA